MVRVFYWLKRTGYETALTKVGFLKLRFFPIEKEKIPKRKAVLGYIGRGMRICFNTCMAKVLQSMDLMKTGTYFRLSTNALIAKTIDRIMKSKNTPPTKIAKPHATESKDNKIRNTIANKPKTMKRIKNQGLRTTSQFIKFPL